MERGAEERGAVERGAEERGAVERGAEERGPVERGAEAAEFLKGWRNRSSLLFSLLPSDIVP